ncbi:hypothetical protein [Paenibacillus sp.]|uniref:hypothetical protein n=1 Tax=Paenibacillus sp. TaxID=58172 RepID=UPI0028AFE630|nr:hypothetical protein [Paenibacillus sp.]
MNNLNFHPIQVVPPNAHALHKWNEDQQLLAYEYNGINIITMHIPNAEDLGFRHGSDGSMQSVQYFQQIYVAMEKPMSVVMTLNLSEDAINMRPKRAKANEAILGQCGNVLIDGVNAVYDISLDLLIDWNGVKWSWLSKEIEIVEGRAIIKVRVELGQKPMFINLRPLYYNKHLGYNYHKPWDFKPNTKPVAGWCSWEAYRRDIDIDKIKNIAKFMAQNFKDYGMEYIQVDDGYQKMPLPANPKGTMEEGWMTCEENKFPDGHQSIVSAINDEGFLPAIWTNANITNPEFPVNNPEAVLWNGDEAIKGEWIDYLYSCTPETLEKHVVPLFKSFKDMGYQYIKIDAIRHLLFDGLHECVRLGLMTNEEAEHKFRAYMEATKRGLGDDVYYLASWGEMHEVVGLVDACRISMDANPTWAGIRMQLFESARWFHTQRILFVNDPDHVCVRTKLDWAKSVLSLISLSGGLYMLSDTLDAYKDEKIDVIRKTLPTLATKTAETGALTVDYPAYTWTKLHGFAVQSHEAPVVADDVSLEDALNMSGVYEGVDAEHPFSSLWSFHINKADRKWCVMARIATLPLEESTISMKTLGLDENKTYLAFDFWKQSFVGEVKGSYNAGSLALGCCEIIALYEKTPDPQVIASDRHVSMDAVSIDEHVYVNKNLNLKLNGIINNTIRYYVYIPEGEKIKNISNNAKIITQTNNIACIEVEFKEKALDIFIEF